MNDADRGIIAPMATQYRAGSSGRRTPKLTDHQGRLMLVWPREMTKFTHPDDTVVDAVSAAAVILDGPNAPGVLPRLVIPQAILVRVLRRRLDAGREDPLLARLRKEPNPASEAPGAMKWLFADPTDEDVRVAMEWLARNPEPSTAAV